MDSSIPTANLNVVSARRKHTKSRQGCLTCKARHVKCDEHRPTCQRCAKCDRECVYPTRLTTQAYTRPRTVAYASPAPVGNHSVSNTTSPAVSCVSPSARLWSELDIKDPAALSFRTGFTGLHMSLLFHATLQMSRYMAVESDVNIIILCALDHANTAPFVLDQLLALSALHCSTEQLDKSSLYHYQAMELQTRALDQFNDKKENMTAQTSIPCFVFVSLLGIHLLRTTLELHTLPLGEFIPAFVSYVRVHRGVRAVTNQHWEEILKSNLKPLLSVPKWADEAETLPSGTQTTQLRSQIMSMADQSLESVEASLQGLHWVQWMLNIGATASHKPARGIHAALAWPVVVPESYIQSLYEHRPEALCVFAFFGAALHQQRQFWAFSNAGAGLVRSVVSHVGPFWSEALSWPKMIINCD